MKYGVCFGVDQPQQVKLAKEAGFDYVECGFQSIVLDSEEQRAAFVNALHDNDIRCEAANCFLPGAMKVIGTDFRRQEMRDFIETGFRRGKEWGLQVVSFGSSGARRLPDEVSFGDGVRQLGLFLRDVVAPLAEKYDITVAVEPLNVLETNIIHTLNEGVMLAAFAGSKNISCLADVYHMQFVNDTNDDIRRLRGCIAHGHISNPKPVVPEHKRTFPKDKNEFDYAGFIAALEDAGCPRCSIEARCFDFPSEVQMSGALLKSL